MPENLPAPQDDRDIEQSGSRPAASGSRRDSSGRKVSGNSGGCLLLVSLAGLALLTGGGAAVWIWRTGYMVL